MSINKKIKSFFNFLKFLIKYPEVLIYGGPSFLRYFSSRVKRQPAGLFSQSGQDSVVLTELFIRINSPNFPRLFVDVGCNHPVKHSNSYFFERYMHFNVLAIDALSNHECLWKTIRPTADFLVKAIGQVHGVVEFEEVEESGASYDMFSSVKGSSIKSTNLFRKTRLVEIAPLTDILLERNLNSVGIMSIDIEGHEHEALLGLDLDKINVEVLIIENNAKNVMGDDLIREYLIKRKFKFIARIWDMDDIFVFEDLAPNLNLQSN